MVYSWPLVVLILFLTLPKPQALACSVIAGFLLLPIGVGMNIPALPPINKITLPALAAGLMLLLGLGRRPAEPEGHVERGGSWIIVTLFLVALFLSPFATTYTNGAPTTVGGRTLPGLSSYDSFSTSGFLVFTTLPYLLARRYLRSPEQHAVLLKIFVLAMLGYSLLTLWEVRMSPQLHRQIYGFFPHSFLQHMRDGGFRPLVFMPHGLWLGILLALSTLGAAGIWRQRRGQPGALRWLLASGWLLMTLALSHNLGALVIAIVFLPVVLFFGVRGQIIWAAVVAALIMTYPMLRAGGLVPTQYAVSLAAAIDPVRAASLQYRFDNEDLLLQHAARKPLAGWGGWGRSRVYDERGRDISTTDGIWLIVFGSYGWLGYIARFGLICAPLLLLLRRRSPAVTPATSALALVLAANLVDMLPNSSFGPLTFLIGGALAGRCSFVPAASGTPAEADEPASVASGSGRSYTRFPATTRA